MTISEETLFERLRSARAPRDPSMALDRARLRRSIARNLQRILASREEHAPAQPDYGMPDPGELAHVLPSGAEHMRRRLKDCVEKFEPRLEDVNVLLVESLEEEHTLRFSIRARVRDLPDGAISFDASVEASGRIRVHA